jgi:pyruvate, water dikinase
VTHQQDSINQILEALQERAKELHCLYRVDELVQNKSMAVEDVFRGTIEAIREGWQYPSVCRARVIHHNKVIQPGDFATTPWVQRAEIRVQEEIVGAIEVYYLKEMPPADEGPFLKEERKLLNTLAERLAYFLLQRRPQGSGLPAPAVSRDRQEWWVILDFLRRTDQHLLGRITRKMINHMCWQGLEEAHQLLHRLAPGSVEGTPESLENRPLRRAQQRDSLAVTDEAFRIASAHLSDDEILGLIHKWIKDDKSTFLLEALEDEDASLSDIADALDRYQGIQVKETELSWPIQVALRVALIRRFLTDQLDFINVAKTYVETRDFYDLVHHIVSPSKGHGRLGGKSSGLFLAKRVVFRSKEYADILQDIKVPKTWYLTSDGLLEFIRYNNLEDLYNRKYLEIDQVRLEYPNIVQLFKNSQFSPEIIKGLSMALDDFEDRPLIVRSSSLLEDRIGAAFSGKYKSLFLANQGSKKQRLADLQDAIAEVYASVFGPDPIEYRAERGMLDLNEEMGIMVQEVVGVRVGDYFLPAFAGVAFSNNEFRWSPRIRREDGLVRLVPGLGTRAVDRLTDDYPVLAAPGQPNLRANVTTDEIVRYSPRKIDVINLATNTFETLDLRDLLRKAGPRYPIIEKLVQVLDEDGRLHLPSLETDWEKDDLVVTFEGLIRDTPFMTQMQALLELLREKMETPIDIEFAHSGEHLYLLQCRGQSYTDTASPSPIPRDIPPDRIVFSANRYISNGRVPDATHVVYVDPDAYGDLADLKDLKDVGRAVGRLNKLLPKRQFILMGPGRWGSRGDIKLGVPVTYSEINNTSVLVEVARKKGNYVPDLSFGTHFFQDLVEARIQYLPLYPDDEDVRFDEAFLTGSPNSLPELLPQFEHLSHVIRVIDVARARPGCALRLVFNAELDEAVAMLVTAGTGGDARRESRIPPDKLTENHWRWRYRMARQIASLLDPNRFGVRALYVFGSTKNATAGPGSDIDVLAHVHGTEAQRQQLLAWLQGWGQCLAEMNFVRTGYQCENLLDVHLVTDEDIAQQRGYASKIGAVTDPARPLEMMRKAPSPTA